MKTNEKKTLNLHYMYDNNKDFKEYVDRYTKTYNIGVEIALTHRLVWEYANYIHMQEQETTVIHDEV